jgi:putative MATE family efflux protein
MLSIKFGPAPFYREAFKIALPVMAQACVQSMVSLIDNFMVAGLGDTSMGAVNVSNQLFFIYIVLINTVCQAGGIYMAQYSGANDAGGMRDALRFKLFFLVIAAALYFAVCNLIPGSMLGVMTRGNAARDEIIATGAGYIKLCSWSLLPMALSFGYGASFREIGRPAVPMAISAAATAVNTIGNYILIYGNFGAPALGVTGAAYATIIARVIEALTFIVFVYAKKPPFYVALKALFAINWPLVRKILSKSAMIFVSEVNWVLSETVMVALYNGRGGAETVAGMAAGWTIGNIFFMVFGGLWTASTVIIGSALGAGKLEEARKKGAWIQSGSVVMGTVTAIAGIGVSALVIPIAFSKLTPDARAICFNLILVILAYLPLWTLINAYIAISRAGGDTTTGLAADLIVNTFIFMPIMFICAFFTAFGPVLMFALAKISDIPKLLIARHFYKKEKWVKNLTVN